MTDLRTVQAGLSPITWEDWLRYHRAFIVRPALADRSAERLGEEAVITSVVESIQNGAFLKGPPRFDPNADDPQTISPFIRNGRYLLSIDTAGRAFHKRGWRTGNHPAVIKESLAATILMLAGYTGDEPLCVDRARSRLMRPTSPYKKLPSVIGAKMTLLLNIWRALIVLCGVE